MQEREARNRARIATGVARAIGPVLIPSTEKRLIEMVALGKAPRAVVGTQVVEALFKSEALLIAVSTGGHFDAPGWRDVYKSEETPRYSWEKPRGGREYRVISYHVTEPGLRYMYDIGGWIRLEVVKGEGGLDFTRWKLVWDPKYPEYEAAPQAAAPTLRPPLSTSAVNRRNIPPPSPIERKPRITPAVPPKPSAQPETPKLPEAPPDAKPTSTPASGAENTGGSGFGKKSYPRRPKPEISEPVAVAPENLAEGEVWHPTHKLGILLKGEDGQPLRDAEGRYLAVFAGPPELNTRIPEALKGTIYIFGVPKPPGTK